MDGYEKALLDFVHDIQQRSQFINGTSKNPRPNDGVVIQKLQEAAALLKQDREAIEGSSNES